MSTVTHAEAVALFERRRNAWVTGDLDAYLALFAPDLVIDIPRRDRIVGRDDYAELVRLSHEHVAPVRFEFHHLAVHGSVVLSEWTIEIEFRADGRRATYDGMSRCELRDGLIASWREYYDPAQLTGSD
jgi:limonene-1,2-epoxide hydrolase